ncbi:helix-turn-helix domain-containing protein [Caballeronia sordidicola]|uniref:helix-turn-helix domain-containing protein n=1 Tax=Caballeronia sordidicola TaxID=196367 RepID=UPI000A3D1E90|nr:helix-turn-helix domain-containing protein [Caballeronia sordidicola]
MAKRIKKAAAPKGAAQSKNQVHPKFTGNSAAAQRNRLMRALANGPISTIEARRRLDIMMPASRIHELRHRDNKNIAMTWVRRPTDSGKLHSVALYSLLPGDWRSE